MGQIKESFKYAKYKGKHIQDSIKDFEQICGFIIGNPIYNYPPKIKKDLKDSLLN